MLSEVGCLALAVYFEARSDPLPGRMFVAQTVINRVESKRFPDTVCDVVLQKKQFSFFNKVYNGEPLIMSDSVVDQRAWNRSIKEAYRFYMNKPDIHDSCHYTTHNVSNKWTKKMEKLIEVDSHTWYGGGC